MKSAIEMWTAFSWHCSNCGTIVTGYKKQNGDIKVQCSRCRAVMVRKLKNRKCDVIELYAPARQERLGASCDSR